MSCQSLTVSGSSLWGGLLAFHLQTALISSLRSRVSNSIILLPKVNYHQNISAWIWLLLQTLNCSWWLKCHHDLYSFKALLSIIKKVYFNISKCPPKSHIACPQQDAIHLPNTTGCPPHVLRAQRKVVYVHLVGTVSPPSVEAVCISKTAFYWDMLKD